MGMNLRVKKLLGVLGGISLCLQQCTNIEPWRLRQFLVFAFGGKEGFSAGVGGFRQECSKRASEQEANEGRYYIPTL